MQNDNTIKAIRKQKQEVLNGHLITSSHDLKSLGALIFSGLISTYGVYSILMGMVEGNSLYVAIGVFIVLLGVADTVKRGSLAKYLNSIIKSKIIGFGKVLYLNMGIAVLAFIFMITFDVVGSFATAKYVNAKYAESKTTDSKEYKLLEDKAKDGSRATSLYMELKRAYDAKETLAIESCNKTWRVPKYRTKNSQCIESWRGSHQEPKIESLSVSSTVTVEEYQKLKENKTEDFLSKYLFNIVLVLSLAITLILQYTTISQIKDEYDDSKENLTVLVVGILRDRLAELEANMIEHEELRNELISEADKSNKEELRTFERLGNAIGIMSLKKAVDSRGDTVQRIANNQSTVKRKAGFINAGGDLKEKVLKGLKSGDKLPSKTELVDMNSRNEKTEYEELMKTLLKDAVIQYQRGKGYFKI